MEASVVEGKQTVQRALPSGSARRRVYDDAGLDINLASGVGVMNLQDARTATKAFDLDDVREPHLLEGSGKPVLLIPGDQIIQHIENEAEPVARRGLLQEKLSA